ncbi:MAG: hypothetical protein B7Z69_08795 [Actinobacteria bacterium 21-73-9]|nr:MAG: hypothetical protein B7Z69_08795 [Actinobacteria bacterium 21-73-9]
MAAGKSTVAEALARRFERSAHVHGDVFRRFIVAGRDPIDPPLSDEAERQLALRRALAANVALAYRAAGFTTILQDLYVGPHLAEVIQRLASASPHVVVLCPSAEAVAERESRREKKGYGAWDVRVLWRTFMEETPRLGLWIDTTSLDVEETVTFILDHLDASRVATSDLSRTPRPS